MEESDCGNMQKAVARAQEWGEGRKQNLLDRLNEAVTLASQPPQSHHRSPRPERGTQEFLKAEYVAVRWRRKVPGAAPWLPLIMGWTLQQPPSSHLLN